MMLKCCKHAPYRIVRYRKLVRRRFFCQTIPVAPVTVVRGAGFFVCAAAHSSHRDTYITMTTELAIAPPKQEQLMRNDTLATNLRNVAIIAHGDLV